LIQGPHVSGELFYEGTNVTLGYAESGRDLSKGDERNGVLSTGDLAMRDEDGYFYIVGRKKRFLKLYGSRVNLDEVEQLLKSRYPELSIACSGVDDKLTIFVAGDSDDHDILKFITEKTTTNPLAFKVKHIEKIPLNEAGKTLYSALESHYD
jgi:acyl-CoA synthetase (AMP-forming)/AMP-acid ligase II